MSILRTVKRTVLGLLKAWLTVLVVGFVLAGTVTFGAGILGAAVPSTGDDRVDEPSAGQPFNHTHIEEVFLQLLNEERQKRSLQPVDQRDALTAMGESHSRVMVEEGHYYHVQPDGTSIEDRYDERGLLPECRLETGGNRYYNGAENIARFPIGELRGEWVPDGSYHVEDESDVAYLLFWQWMKSDGHREAMLVDSADEAGLGLAFDPADGEIYASLELC